MLAIPPATPVAEVIALMNESSTGCALVVDRGALVGIFTERDVLRKVAGRTDSTALLVGEVMTRDPDTLPQTASVAFALNRMSVEGYRHIPLLDDDGAPVGVVGMRDIINWLVDLFPYQVLSVPPNPRSSYPRTPEGG
jgi:CBS domain-containing protein